VETLREFRVLTNNYPAQYGRSIGAVIEVASRAGSNELHGTLFEFLRNDKFDSRSFFDEQKPALRRNQWGGVAGGPIVRDRAFFFGSYEAFFEENANTQVELVPTLAAKTTGDLGDGRRVTVNPNVKPWTDVYPLPTNPLGGGVGTVGLPAKISTREHFFTGRIDYQLSPDVTYFGRYQGDNTYRKQPRGPGNLPIWGEKSTTFSHIAAMGETRILTPQLINEFRAGFVRSNPTNTNDSLGNTDPNLTCPPTLGHCRIQFGQSYWSGLTLARIGSFGRSFERYTGNTYQVSDNMSYVTGQHALKWGFNLERFQDNVLFKAGTGNYDDVASYNFDGLVDLLAGEARSFSGSFTTSPSGAAYRQWLYGFFLQDDYRLFPRFTLNLGLRYERTSNYRDMLKRIQLLQHPGDYRTQPVQVGREYAWDTAPCKGCLEPRFGWAWDMLGTGKAVLKGGFGMFHNQITRMMAFYPLSSAAAGGTGVSVDFPVFGTGTTGGHGVAARPVSGGRVRQTASGTGATGANVQRAEPPAPTALHWNLTLDQQLSSNMTFRLGYVGSKGYHLDGGYDVNKREFQDLPDGTRVHIATAGRIRPAFGSNTYTARDFNSYYNALTATIGQRMSRGLGFEFSYAFSRATDDTSVGGRLPAHQLNEPENIDERRHVTHGQSAMSLKHRAVVNTTYEFPAFNLASGFADRLVSGWQINSIITLQGGVPMTPVIGFDQANSLMTQAGAAQRPSYKPSAAGIPLCPCTMPTAVFGGGTQDRPQRYFDPTVFALPARGYYGNVGRGVMLGPGLVNFDISLVKNTRFSERFNLQFKAEGFNVFNNVNFANPNSTIFADSSGAFSPAAGLITSTVGTGRQIQLALKLLF
ncbi:MAG: TonB-dependent receptor, partial [Acidobacteria bacterium]|nr:TonB-dependent receptor [Acidobacteriota bacterium]